jgi:hypothetical protein
MRRSEAGQTVVSRLVYGVVEILNELARDALLIDGNARQVADARSIFQIETGSERRFGSGARQAMGCDQASGV